MVALSKAIRVKIANLADPNTIQFTVLWKQKAHLV